MHKDINRLLINLAKQIYESLELDDNYWYEISFRVGKSGDVIYIDREKILKEVDFDGDREIRDARRFFR